MKPKIAIAALVVAVLAWQAARALRHRDPAHPLVVHEWGTFVSLQGSDGVALEGLQHETERLPDFVHSSTVEYPSPFRALGDTTLDVPVHHCRGKGETPVLYFYSDDVRRVRVRVDFPHGLLTQWYPASFDQSAGLTAGGPFDLSRIESTYLDWDLELVPPSLAKDRAAPAVDPGERWGWARVRDADFVRGGGEDEQFVFYRGLGTIDLPITVGEVTTGGVTVTNRSRDPVAAAFLIDMDAGGGSVTRLGAIPGGGRLPATVGPRLPRARAVEELEAQVAAALIAEGLFPAEAQAMVRTWSSAWFGNNGHRVLYFIPRRDTDALLPLQITPPPDRLVRVLVGRLDYLTSDEENAIAQDLVDAISPDPEVRARAMGRLAALGRFLEPSVRRAIVVSKDRRAQVVGNRILSTFR